MRYASPTGRVQRGCALDALEPVAQVHVSGPPGLRVTVHYKIVPVEEIVYSGLQFSIPVNDGVEVSYEGVWLHEVLKAAGVPGGTELRGKALTIFVVAGASDGYQAIFSVAELDPAFTDNQVLLADNADGKALFGAQGTFRLVAPKEKRGARSVRMLRKLEVVQFRK